MQITNTGDTHIRILFFPREASPDSALAEIIRDEQTGEPRVHEIFVHPGSTFVIGANLSRLLFSVVDGIPSLEEVEESTTDGIVAAIGNGTRVVDDARSAALRKAQLELLLGESEPAWRAAYYWAPFVLHGEWRANQASPIL